MYPYYLIIIKVTKQPGIKGRDKSNSIFALNSGSVGSTPWDSSISSTKPTYLSACIAHADER